LQYLRQEVHTNVLFSAGLDAVKLATDTYGDQLTLAVAAKYCPANHW